MTESPLAQIVGWLKSEPSRTGSLIMTFYGDAITPRGGSVWLGTLQSFCSLIDIHGGVVRTAVSRLATDGWLARDKAGRKSFYRLADASRERFETGIQHVYSAEAASLENGLALILIAGGPDREASRAALVDAGFGSPMPGVWVGSAGVATPESVKGAIRIDVAASNEMGRRLIQNSWPLADIAAGYRDFLKTFQPLAARLRDCGELDASDAIVGRVLMIHQYRRVLLRDPLLPMGFLPSDWPAQAARDLCGEIYRALIAPSERWLDAYGVGLSGPLPSPDRKLTRRFRQS